MTIKKKHKNLSEYKEQTLLSIKKIVMQYLFELLLNSVSLA